MRGILALVLAAVFGGLGPIFGKYALQSFSEAGVTFWRSLICLPVFWLILRVKGRRFQKNSLKRLFLLGIFASGNVFFFIFGLEKTTAIMASLLYLLAPGVILLLARWLFKEKITKSKAGGLGAAFLGVLFILWRSAKEESIWGSLGTPLGNFLILLGVFSWSGYLLRSQKLRKEFLPEELTFYSLIVIGILSLPLFLREVWLKSWVRGAIVWEAVLGIILMALVNSIGMVLLYQYGVRRTSAFAAGAVAYLSPFVAALAAVGLFGERVSWELGAGGILIMAGIFISVVLPKNRERAGRRMRKN